jgi:mitogen-activated protein kinase kinase kinase
MTNSKAYRVSLQGSIFWMAPESVKQTNYSSKSDIWSVGCLVVEMLTGSHPWSDLSQMQAIFRVSQARAEHDSADVRSARFNVRRTQRTLRPRQTIS